jgi:hypothetical protein
MSPVPLSRFALAAALACFLGAAPAYAADPAPNPKEKATPPGERIRKIFEQKITIEIKDQPLLLALNQLREQTKINFVLDRFTIQQMGLDPESLPVNVKAKDEKVIEVLKKIVEPYNLRSAIIGDAVFISTDAMTMDRQLRQHISVDFEKVEVAAALKQLAKETGMKNIVLDPTLEKGKAGKALVTLQMEDVPLETAVRLLAETAGLRAVREPNSNVLKVTPRPQAEEPLNVGPKNGPAGKREPPDDGGYGPPVPKDDGKKP